MVQVRESTEETLRRALLVCNDYTLHPRTADVEHLDDRPRSFRSNLYDILVYGLGVRCGLLQKSFVANNV